MSPLLPLLILAGGAANRLRPATEHLPKALMPVNGIPFIHHQLQLVYNQGIREVIICIDRLGEMIMAAIDPALYPDMQIRYSFDGDKLLGTAGAVYHALPLIQCEHFFVLYGDSYLECNFADIQHYYQQQSALGLMTVFRNPDGGDSNNVDFAEGKIKQYSKSSAEKWDYIDYGLSIFAKTSFAGMPEIPLDLAVIHQALIATNQLLGFEMQTKFYEIGSFAGIAELAYYLSSSSRSQV